MRGYADISSANVQDFWIKGSEVILGDMLENQIAKCGS